MKDVALAVFQLSFKNEVVQFQGFLFFALGMFWLGSLWRPLIERARSSRIDRIWMGLCLLFSVFVAVVFTMAWGSEFTLLAISLAFALGLALVHPTAAVCLLTSLLFLRPWELISGEDDYFAMLPKLTFGLCIAHVALIMATKKSVKPAWNTITTLLACFAAWAYLSTFKAPDPILSQFKFGETFFKSLFLYMMILNVVSNELELRTLLGSIVATFLGVGLISIYQTLAMADALGQSQRLLGIGAFSNSNDVAALMVLVFPFAMASFRARESSWFGRGIAALVMAVVFVSIYLSQSRGAMVALALALGLYFALKIKNRKVTIAFFVTAGLALAAFTQMSSRNADDLAESSSSRMTYIKTGLNMGVRNPILGVGYESYEEQFEVYATEILYEWGHRTAHNSWILTFAETGLPGLLLFLGVFAMAVRFAWAIFPTSPEFLLSIVGYGVAITFLSHSYLLYPYLLYGLIGVAHRVKTEPASDAASSA